MAEDTVKLPKHSKYISVYAQDDPNVEKWIKDELVLQGIAGDYKEEGVYEGKIYYLKKQNGSNPLCIFWSTYLGFDGGWFIGPVLGGSSLVWAMVDQSLPPEDGWLMRGRLPGFHVDTPLKVQQTSVMRHEIHVAENVACAPVHCMASVGQCLEGVAIATVSGDTKGVTELRSYPKSVECWGGMLKDMSCTVPLSYAFEHSIDAWYKAWFVNGFCHTMSYQRSITGAERSLRLEEKSMRLRYQHWLYHGYSSAVAEEIACHEPFAHALEDLFNIHIHLRDSASKVQEAKARAKAKGKPEETGCHAKVSEMIEHLCCMHIDTTTTGTSGSAPTSGFKAAMMRCFGSGQGKPSVVKTREITVQESQPAGQSSEPAVKEREATTTFVAPTSLYKLKTLSEQSETDEAARKTLMQQIQNEVVILETKLQGKALAGNEESQKKIQELQGEIQYWKEFDARKAGTDQVKMEDSYKEKVAELQKLNKLHSARCEKLTSAQDSLQVALQQKNAENTVLLQELESLKGAQPTTQRDLGSSAMSQSGEVESLRATKASLEKKLAEMTAVANTCEERMGSLETQQASRAQLEAQFTQVTQKFAMVETLAEQKSKENELLQAEVDTLKKELQAFQAKSTEKDVLLETQDAYSKRVSALEDQIKYMRENEASTRASLQNFEAMHKEKSAELERMSGAFAQTDALHKEASRDLEKISSSYAAVQAMHDQKSSELEKVSSNYAQVEAMHNDKTLELERLTVAYAERCAKLEEAEGKLLQMDASLIDKVQMLEASLGQKTVETEQLMAEVIFLKQKVEEQSMKEMELQQKETLLGATPSQSSSEREAQLEQEIQYLRETETNNVRAYQLLEQQHFQKCQELESQVLAAQHDASIEQQRVAEAEKLFENKIREMEDSYGSQMQSISSQAQGAEALKQQLQVTAIQTEADKARLSQYERELGEALTARAQLQDDCSRLMSQLDNERKEKGEHAKGMQDSFDSMRQAVESAHAAQIQQLQASHAVQIEQLQAVVADGNKQSAALEEKLVSFEQQYQESDGLYVQLEDLKKQAQQLDEMLLAEREMHEGTKQSLIRATEEKMQGEAKQSDDTKMLEAAYVKIQQLELETQQYDEQMRSMDDVFAQRQGDFEAEIASLRQQVLMQASPNDDYARATRELRELSSAMEAERELYNAQMEELQQALMRSQEEVNLLKGELEQRESQMVQPMAVETVVQPATMMQPVHYEVVQQPPSPVKTSAVPTVAYPQRMVETVVQQPTMVETVAHQPTIVYAGSQTIDGSQRSLYASGARPVYHLEGAPTVVQRMSSGEAKMQETMVLPSSGTLPGSGGTLRLPQSQTIKYEVVSAPQRVVGAAPPVTYSMPQDYSLLPQERVFTQIGGN